MEIGLSWRTMERGFLLAIADRCLSCTVYALARRVAELRPTALRRKKRRESPRCRERPAFFGDESVLNSPIVRSVSIEVPVASGVYVAREV